VVAGMWPYLKVLIMLVVWFKPMRNYSRTSTLRLLTRFSKWSLLYVISISIVCAGVRINNDVDGFQFILIGEPRLGVIAFCIATIMDISQGEWMRAQQFEIVKKRYQPGKIDKSARRWKVSWLF